MGGFEAGSARADLLCEASPRLGRKRRVTRPPRVEIDNDVAAEATVVDVYAADRPALLYRIARGMFRSGLDIRTALINTHLHEVLDVFYVTDSQGRKIEDLEELKRIEEGILEGIGEGTGDGTASLEAAASRGGLEI